MRSPYYFDWDENGVRVRVDTRTGEKTPVSEIVRRKAEEGSLVTMDQAMANRHREEERRKKSDIDDIEEV